MLDPLPYYKWLVRDYRSNRKVQRMGYVAKGLYRELIDEAWLEGYLPNDLAQLAEICGCPLAVMKKSWPEIAPCFAETEHGLVSLKLEGMRTDLDATRVKRSVAGRGGAVQKLANASNCQQLPASDLHGLAGASNCHIAEQSRAEQSRVSTPPPRERETVPDDPPEGLPTLSYALGMLERLGLIPEFATHGQKQAAAAAIGKYARDEGISQAQATVRLVPLARGAIESGAKLEFWLKDFGWKEKRGSSKPSGTQERVNSTVNALREAVARRTGSASAHAVRADGGALPAPGLSPGDGGIPARLRGVGAQVRDGPCAAGAHGSSHQAGAEILPPAE